MVEKPTASDLSLKSQQSSNISPNPLFHFIDAESPEPRVRGAQPGLTFEVVGPPLIKVVPPKRNVVVNLTNCRTELDTLQYACRVKEYITENKAAENGNIYWYGLALRDNDMDLLKSKQCLINRYPLMDVSRQSFLIFLFVAFCQKEHLLRDYFAPSTLLPQGIQLYAPLVLAAR